MARPTTPRSGAGLDAGQTPEAAQVTGRVVVRNVLYNFLGQIWLLVVTLAATPFIVRGLGVEAYGVYALLVALTTYLTVFDLGLNAAVVKYVSEHHGAGDRRALERVIRTATGAYIVVGLVGGAVVALTSPWLLGTVFDVPANLEHSAQVAAYIAAGAFALNMPLLVFDAVPVALQRADLTVRRNLLLGTASAAGTAILAEAGAGLVAVIAYTSAVTVVAFLVFVQVTRRLLPDISFVPRPDRETFRRIGRFGAFKFVGQLSTQTVYQADKVIVAALVSIAGVTYYVIPLSLAQKLTSVVANVSFAFFPAASNLLGGGDHARFEELYLRAMKLSATLLVPPTVLLLALASPLLELYLGQSFADHGTTVLRLLAAAYFLHSLATLPAFAADATGHPGVNTFFSVVSLALNLALALILVPLLGINGAALAILINGAVQVPAFLWYVHRRFIPVTLGRNFALAVGRPLVGAVPMALIAFGLAGWVDSWVRLVAVASIALLAYAAAVFAVGGVDRRDRTIVLQTLRPRTRP